MNKFKDVLHDDMEDGFKVEIDHRGRVFVRIYQEMDSGVIREVFLSAKDIEQIQEELKKVSP